MRRRVTGERESEGGADRSASPQLHSHFYPHSPIFAVLHIADFALHAVLRLAPDTAGRPVLAGLRPLFPRRAYS
jgi:hypothetical protein